MALIRQRNVVIGLMVNNYTSREIDIKYNF
jgi:hypothetical protein